MSSTKRKIRFTASDTDTSEVLDSTVATLHLSDGCNVSLKLMARGNNDPFSFAGLKI